MALPTSAPVTASDAFARVVATAGTVKSSLGYVGGLITTGGPVYMDNLIGLYTSLNGARAIGYAIQTTPGLPAYAQTAMGDPSYDIVASFQASVVACTQVTDWLLASMPSDGQGGFVGWRHQTDGTIQRVTVDPGTLAPLSPLIASALATFA